MSDPRAEREREAVPASWIEPVEEPPIRIEPESDPESEAQPDREPTVAQDLWEEMAALRRGFGGTRGRSTATYQVPKRFGMGPLMGMMLLYSVIFACLRWANCPAWAYLFLGLLGVVIGFGQMQGQSSPRFSSILTGALALPGFLLAYVLFAFVALGGIGPGELIASFCAAVGLFFLGGFVGYVVGTVLAGVFLVGDQVEQAIYRWTGQKTADFSDGDASHKAPA